MDGLNLLATNRPENGSPLTFRHGGSLVVSSFCPCASDKPREGERLGANGHPPGKRDSKVHEKGYLSTGLSSFISGSAPTGQGMALTTTGLLVTVLASFMPTRHKSGSSEKRNLS